MQVSGVRACQASARASTKVLRLCWYPKNIKKINAAEAESRSKGPEVGKTLVYSRAIKIVMGK